MWTFLSGVIFGLLASCRSDQLQVNSRSCSFAGVFLAEGASRHSLNFDNAEKVCQQLETVIASPEQLEDAYEKKMETCRNGWIKNVSIAILRHKSHEKCANNMTGLIINSHKTADELFDVYCYDEEAGSDKNCTKRFQSNANFNSPAPAEPDASTTAGSKEQLEPRPTTWDAGDSESGHSTEPTGDNALDKTMTTPAFINIEPGTASREYIETNSFEGNGNSGVGSNFTMDGLDPSAGSGMQEEEEAFTVTHADVPQESLGENEQSSGEPKEEDRAATGQPNDKKQIFASDQKDSDSSSDWLIVIVVIVAVAAILLVCAAVAKRKSWCGRQKTLVITSKDGSEGNGAAAASSSHNQEREQEMVTLMNKENIQENGNTEEFTVITLEESPDKDQQA